jgi:hypothetical protein
MTLMWEIVLEGRLKMKTQFIKNKYILDKIEKKG